MSLNSSWSKDALPSRASGMARGFLNLNVPMKTITLEVSIMVQGEEDPGDWRFPHMDMTHTPSQLSLLSSCVLLGKLLSLFSASFFIYMYIM